MADVTISQLGLGTPTTGIVIPYSDGTSTYQAKLSSLLTATGDMGTTGIQLPKGTTAQRINTEGLVRYNTTTKSLEYFNGYWITVTGSYVLDALIVAGGGGGGGRSGAGGGGGGFLEPNNINIIKGVTYDIVVGQGGAGGVSSPPGSNGQNSIAFGYTAIGGGGGADSENVMRPGLPGGSGGGGAYGGNGGSGVTGQGYAGGNSCYQGTYNYKNGGGGGAGGIGLTGNCSTGKVGNGGPGKISNITGEYYGGGGGGGSHVPINSSLPENGRGYGGIGGGGNGGNPGNYNDGSPGQTNTGGGGGGPTSLGGGANSGGNGGSGIVAIKVPTSLYSGITSGSTLITTSGEFTIVKFLGNGSYTG